MNTASYSLITMQPSIERLDVLCVGAAIISNGQWTICTLPDVKKIQSVDGGFKQSVLINTAASLEKLFSECVSLVQARNLLVNNRSAVRLHDFEGVFAYESDEDFQNQLSAIMAESVIPIAIAKDAPPKMRRIKPRIRTRLRQQFEHMGILGKSSDDINAHKVVPNYPVSVQHGLVAEFAIKNGVMSFTETLDFDVSDDGVRNRIFEAQAKCLVMKTAIETFGMDTKRHIVVAGANSSHAARSVDLLSTVGSLYALENSADMAAYFSAMEKSAQHIG